MKFKLLVSLHYHFKMINQTFLFSGLQRGWAGRRPVPPLSWEAQGASLPVLFGPSLKVCTQNLQLSFAFSPLSQEVLKLSYLSKTKVEQCVKGFSIRPTEK